jgi:hypothetical protein
MWPAPASNRATRRGNPPVERQQELVAQRLHQEVGAMIAGNIRELELTGLERAVEMRDLHRGREARSGRQ